MFINKLVKLNYTIFIANYQTSDNLLLTDTVFWGYQVQAKQKQLLGLSNIQNIIEK